MKYYIFEEYTSIYNLENDKQRLKQSKISNYIDDSNFFEPLPMLFDKNVFEMKMKVFGKRKSCTVFKNQKFNFLPRIFWKTYFFKQDLAKYHCSSGIWNG